MFFGLGWDKGLGSGLGGGLLLVVVVLLVAGLFMQSGGLLTVVDVGLGVGFGCSASELRCCSCGRVRRECTSCGRGGQSGWLDLEGDGVAASSLVERVGRQSFAVEGPFAELD